MTHALQALLGFAACVAVAAGMLHPVLRDAVVPAEGKPRRALAAWPYLFALLGPLAILFLLGNTLTLLLDKLTMDKEGERA